jgi:hypothetical protein
LDQRQGLFALRRTIGVAREDIVRVANVSLGTIRNAEKGKTIKERSAWQILNGVNHWLMKSNKPVLSSLDDLGISWK